MAKRNPEIEEGLDDYRTDRKEREEAKAAYDKQTQAILRDIEETTLQIDLEEDPKRLRRLGQPAPKVEYDDYDD